MRRIEVDEDPGLPIGQIVAIHDTDDVVTEYRYGGYEDGKAILHEAE